MARYGNSMDYGFLNLFLTTALLIATFAFRKRILAAFGRLLLNGAIEFVRGTFLVEEVTEGPDGTEVARIGLSVRGRAIVGALVPVLIAEVAKSIKLKPGGLPSLPQGIDLSNLSEALPAILPMLPKRYQGIAALLAPLASQFLGGAKTEEKKGSSGEVKGLGGL